MITLSVNAGCLLYGYGFANNSCVQVLLMAPDPSIPAIASSKL